MKKITAENAVKELKAIGINMVKYKSGPLGKYNVSLAKTSNGDGIRYWLPENSETEVSINKRKRQAVLRVTENSRIVSNRFRRSVKAIEKDGTSTKRIKEGDTLPVSQFKKYYEFDTSDNSLLIYVPNSRFTAERVKIQHAPPFSTIYVTILGVSKAPKTTTTFLIGVDEKKHFISVLKTPVETVEEAHKELRPKGISKDAVRQGEWFFDPVKSEKEVALILEKGSTYPYGRNLEPNSSHRANIYISFNKQSYVIGKIEDSRKDYHKPLVLTKLHKVVRNNEVVFKIEPRNYD